MNPIFTVTIDCYNDFTIQVWAQTKEKLTPKQQEYLEAIQKVAKKLRIEKVEKPTISDN